MKYVVYKLKFKTGVHFGKGDLGESDMRFRADTLFSALYIEALKSGDAETLLRAVKDGRLLFSDAFPYIGGTYLVPKPMLYVESKKSADVSERKKYKKLSYVPVDQLQNFLQGSINVDGLPTAFGSFEQVTKASIRGEEETKPYQVGVFRFDRDCGLYVICACEDEEIEMLVSDLLSSLSYAGIGGKRASGLGKFDVCMAKVPALEKMLETDGRYQMLLSTALPEEEALEEALEGAVYLLEKRSGFIASDTYAETFRKKRDLYVFSSGSCFPKRFRGDVMDVSDGGAHPVYRYAKAMFLGIE